MCQSATRHKAAILLACQIIQLPTVYSRENVCSSISILRHLIEAIYTNSVSIYAGPTHPCQVELSCSVTQL